MAMHVKRVFSVPSVKCSHLIVHGRYTALGLEDATKAYAHAKENGVQVTLKIMNEEGIRADHCQHGNPTIGQEFMGNRLVDLLGIKERAQIKRALPLIS